MFTPVFEGMMDKGLICRDDPEMVAFAYTAPISALIHHCDREPEKMEEQKPMPGIERSTQLKELIAHLVGAKAAYGSAKQFAKMAIEDPAGAQEAARAAKELTEGLRLIQTLA